MDRASFPCRIGGACLENSGLVEWADRSCAAGALPMRCSDHSPRLGERCRTMVRRERSVDRCHRLPAKSGVRQVLLELRDAALFFNLRGQPVKLEGLGTYTTPRP
jgi:hypothetical protein